MMLRPKQSPDLNPVAHVYVSKSGNIFWKNTLHPSSRVEAVLASRGGPTPY